MTTERQQQQYLLAKSWIPERANAHDQSSFLTKNTHIQNST